LHENLEYIISDTGHGNIFNKFYFPEFSFLENVIFHDHFHVIDLFDLQELQESLKVDVFNFEKAIFLYANVNLKIVALSVSVLVAFFHQIETLQVEAFKEKRIWA